MRTQFVTACDLKYAAQNLALYRSLERHCSGDWQMYWIVLDREAYVRLRFHQQETGAWDRLTFGDAAAIASRDVGLTHCLQEREGTPAWFWTWASVCAALLCNSTPEHATVYLDSDCYGFGDPMPGVQEALDAGADVGLVSHRFPAHRQHQQARAHHNVGSLTTFLPTPRARACAAWWASMVKSRCVLEDPGDAFLGIPPGRAGDQSYLDAFERIARVHEIAHPGIGLAPYNWDGPDVDVCAARLAHFHEWRFARDGSVERRCNYPIPDGVRDMLVTPYEAAVRDAAQELTDVL